MNEFITFKCLSGASKSFSLTVEDRWGRPKPFIASFAGGIFRIRANHPLAKSVKDALSEVEGVELVDREGMVKAGKKANENKKKNAAKEDGPGAAAAAATAANSQNVPEGDEK